jgi:hypothetical protein
MSTDWYFHVRWCLIGVQWYMDQLGLLANRGGTSRSIRQEIVTAKPNQGGDYAAGVYALIGYDLSVRPDFFISILWSRLMGSMTSFVTTSSSPSVRAYASASENQTPALSVLILNFSPSDRASVSLPGTAYDSDRTEWLLTSPSLASSALFLNGEQLALNQTTGNLPVLSGKRVVKGGAVIVPPLSAMWIQTTNTAGRIVGA